MKKTLFLDTEFTSLSRSGQLMSLALLLDDRRWFYAVFTDFDRDALSDWHRENVLPHLYEPFKEVEGSEAEIRCVAGDTAAVAGALRQWLAPLGPVEIWADVLAYDWVFFCELFGGALQLPDTVSYIPLDLATLLKLEGIDPDSDRVALAGLGLDSLRHNALADARISRRCYLQLMQKAAVLTPGRKS